MLLLKYDLLGNKVLYLCDSGFFCPVKYEALLLILVENGRLIRTVKELIKDNCKV